MYRGLAGSIFQLASQAHDLCVDGSVVNVVVVQARHLDELIAGKDALWGAQEHD
jgi:hypothetical protein